MMNNRQPMNRNERRQAQRAGVVHSTPSNAFTPAQNRLVEKLAIEKASIYIQNTAKLINTCYFNAMRTNRVGEERALRILNQTEILIKIESRRVT